MNTEIYLPSVPESATYGPNLDTTDNGWLPVPASFADDLGSDRDFHFSAWCVSIWKRVFDLTCVVPALLLLSPVLAVVAFAIRTTSSGPVIFCQKRAGRHRKLFTIYKFRTMVENSESIGPEHTAKDDPRITPIGRFLRRFKLDELPQLYNVLRGDMSLVGPRPKLPNHEHTRMACRPGVTGAATLAFCDEQQILSQVPLDRLESFYIERVVPLKIQLDADYMRTATLPSDLGVLFSTVLSCGASLRRSEVLLVTERFPDPGMSHTQIATELAGD